MLSSSSSSPSSRCSIVCQDPLIILGYILEVVGYSESSDIVGNSKSSNIIGDSESSNVIGDSESCFSIGNGMRAPLIKKTEQDTWTGTWTLLYCALFWGKQNFSFFLILAVVQGKWVAKFVPLQFIFSYFRSALGRNGCEGVRSTNRPWIPASFICSAANGFDSLISSLPSSLWRVTSGGWRC